AAWRSLAARIAEPVAARVSNQQRSLGAVRSQVASGLEAMRLAIEAVEARLHGEIEALSGTNVERVRGIGELAEQTRARVDQVLSEVAGRVGDVLAGTRLDSAS